jgi:DNA-binding NarL/FixJ family response regulator
MVAFGHQLSSRETEVIDLAAHGSCDKEIASELGVSIATVRTYWDRIRTKTATRSRTHACCSVVLSKQGTLGVRGVDQERDPLDIPATTN